jgi:KUP system potassium uptake protein
VSVSVSTDGKAELPDVETETHGHGRAGAAALTLGALGVVFGDIGTSPLYAMREVFRGSHELVVTQQRVSGVVSLVFWSLMIIVTLKYVAFIMRADNQGEGGIMALISLVQSAPFRTARARAGLIALGIFGAALFYGDGMITPATSVLSAVEGLGVAAPSLEHLVIPITLVIIVGLFAIQRFGTGTVGRLFGPIMVAWFGILAASGIHETVKHPTILKALSPLPALQFLFDEPGKAFLALGSVVLVVTGAEALYADMGHFGRPAIARAWLLVVYPALLLQYMGQGALILNDPTTAESPFFNLFPGWAQLPMVLLATAATVIASQAVISGAFSVTRQAVQLGFLPRMRIHHTSQTEFGQIYVPAVNWALMIAVVGLVIGFRSSSHLASAYGIAVTGTLAVDTLLAFIVVRLLWKKPLWIVVGGAVAFLTVDLSFFAANTAKILHGGWFPLAIGALVFVALTTWRRGRELLKERMREKEKPLSAFVAALSSNPPVRVPGCAVFLTAVEGGTPRALLHNLEHNRVLHQKVVIFTARTLNIPHAPEQDRLRVEHLWRGLRRVTASYGFQEIPDIPQTLRDARRLGLDIDPDGAVYFLNRVNFVSTPTPGMARWRERLFAAMSRNSTSAAQFFNIPSEQITELGMQVDL